MGKTLRSPDTSSELKALQSSRLSEVHSSANPSSALPCSVAHKSTRGVPGGLMFTPEREMAPLNHAFSSVGVRKYIVCLTFAPGLSPGPVARTGKEWQDWRDMKCSQYSVYKSLSLLQLVQSTS